MSYGIVICNICSREVHQSENYNWLHCEDKSPLCEGAIAVYPRNLTEIKGKYCGIDEC